ncbi:mechanosensitive ion channel protein MscS [Oerskovia turbata]
MDERHEGRIVIRSARTGRPASHERAYKPGELVRLDARIPATIAQRLYDIAHESGLPVTVVLANVLSRALDEGNGAAMG